VSPLIQIGCLLPQAPVYELLTQFLPSDRFNVTNFDTIEQLSKNLIEEQSNQDCLIIWLDETDRPDQDLGKPLDLGICLPTVIIVSHSQVHLNSSIEATYPYPVKLEIENLVDLPEAIDQAIALFLRLPTEAQISKQVSGIDRQIEIDRLVTAQQRLSEKLQERLGYLGVYYKRDSKQFWRRLSDVDKALYIQRLQEIYRSVVLEYFKEKSKHLNTLIDEFASMCFFADISVSQVLQIHMELMEDFAKQLRLEGRNEEILLDYRITLIDAIAHLCEMYRRSIPKEPLK
jgi:circadian clock protein KaiA